MSGVTPRGIRYPDGASKAKNLGPELQQMAEDIDDFLLPSNAHFLALVTDAVELALSAIEVKPVKCIHREAGKWVWDGPGSPAATHYLLPDHTGALVARATVWPAPTATPVLNW